MCLPVAVYMWLRLLNRVCVCVRVWVRVCGLVCVVAFMCACSGACVGGESM